MNTVQQAIKIEYLKDERSKMINPLQLQLVRDITPRIRAIDNQIASLHEERIELVNKAVELRDRIKSHENHFDLMIKAYQSINQKNTLENKTK